MQDEKILEGICCEVENCVHNNGNCCCTAQEIKVKTAWPSSVKRPCARPLRKFRLRRKMSAKTARVICTGRFHCTLFSTKQAPQPECRPFPPPA